MKGTKIGSLVNMEEISNPNNRLTCEIGRYVVEMCWIWNFRTFFCLVFRLSIRIMYFVKWLLPRNPYLVILRIMNAENLRFYAFLLTHWCFSISLTFLIANSCIVLNELNNFVFTLIWWSVPAKHFIYFTNFVLL